ncbi:MAG: ferrous iron transport protein B [Acidobacteriota bacterium]|nr:ferrous iron transport protein B [Acidobacteriota bacterium]
MSRPDIPVAVFVGQPNSGKSTLFNALAGHKAETSNFPGTTFTHMHSNVNDAGRLLTIVDLPGTYSLCPSDPHEQVPLVHLFTEKPDIVVNVIDASILSRSLEFTLELVELGYPLVVALNMIDLAESKGVTIDPAALEALLGVPVIPTIATHGRGVKQLLDAAFDVLARGAKPDPRCWSGDVEDKVRELESLIPEDYPILGNRRFTAVKLLESAHMACDELLGEIAPELKGNVERIRREMEAHRGVPAYEIISAERHHLALKFFEQSSRVERGRRLTWDKKIDGILMHPFFGYVIMAAVFLAFFLVIFKIGTPLEELVLGPLGSLREILKQNFGGGPVFVVLDGLIQGFGGGLGIVLPFFIPLLFLMSLLDDLGYLSRAGFLLDTFMHRLGLHGKSVSLFLLGFGCNVPAIMATRILESRRDRILTTLLIPFIPCAARTTIILALVAYYLGPFWALGFYAVNLVIVAVLGWILSRFFKGASPGLILEIPSLKIPRLRNIWRKTWLQLYSFIRFAWPILIGGSIVLSILHALGADRHINTILSPLVSGALGLPDELGVTLIFGFLRKELSLIMMLQALGVEFQDVLTVLSREQVLVFSVFISFFIPCLSTVAVIWKEIGRLYALLSAALNITVALLLSLLVRLLI